MKRFFALCLLIVSPLLAAPASAPWWQPPPEVVETVRGWTTQLLVPNLTGRRSYREVRQARDRQGVVWLTLVKVGDDVKEFNRDGALVCHGYLQGRQFVVFALSPDGKWQRVR